MKNKRWVIACVVAAIMVLFVGCPNPSGNGNSNTNTNTQSLTDRINGASGTIDFNNARISENAEVNSAVTIKNLKMGGKALTINVAGVVLEAVSEAKIIIGEGVGDGDVSLTNCTVTNLEVKGGGANSIHVTRSRVESVQIKKDNARIVLKNTNVTAKLSVEAKQTKLEVNDEAATSTSTIETSKVATIEIAPTVDNVKIKDVKVDKISVKAAASSSTATPTPSPSPAVTMTGSIQVAEIEGKDLNVVLAKGAEITSKVSVKAENLTLEMKDTTSKIENLEITNNVENVNISGGTIEKIDVKTDTSAQTPQTPAINITGNVAITEVTGTTTLNVAEDVVDDFEEPEGITVEPITISSVTLIKENIKTEYVTREIFDYSGLYAEILYSNNAKQIITLTKDNCTASGFNSSSASTVTVTILYSEQEIGSFTVTIIKKVTDTKLIKAENVKKEYIQGDSFDYSGLSAEISYSDYTTEEVTLTATNCTVSGFDSSKLGTATVKITYDGKEIGSFTVTIIENTATAELHKAAADGYISQALEKLIPTSSSGMPDVDGAVALFKQAYNTYKTDKTRLYYALAELASISTDGSVAKLLKENYGFKNYPATMNALISGDWMKEYIVPNGGTSKGPEFLIPTDIDQDSYNSTLYNTMQTSETMSYLLLMNILSCNPDGFNDQIDNILDIFGTKYNNAKTVAAEISQESFELPAILINALNLDQMLGSSTIKIGKAEVDVLFAATDIVKGLFQWLSSYDLSMDLKDSLWSVYNSSGGTDAIAIISKISNANSLGLRNANAMDESKATIIGALNSVLSSYKYITETSGTYPSGIKDTIKQYGDSIYGMVANCVTALRTGTKFELDIPNTFTLSLDLGKLFTPGYLSDIYEKDSAGNIKIALKGYYYTDRADNISYNSNRTQKLLSKPIVLDFTKDINSQFDAAIKTNLPWSNISSDINTIYVTYALLQCEPNDDLINDLISLTVNGRDVINRDFITSLRGFDMKIRGVNQLTYTRQ